MAGIQRTADTDTRLGHHVRIDRGRRHVPDRAAPRRSWYQFWIRANASQV